MKQTSIKALLILLMAWIPSSAFAAFSFIWSPPPTDKSIEYLGMIFGNVGSALTGTGSPIIGNLFYIFNIAVLSLGSIVVSYTVILSTMNTAQEGEVMGKKWSSVWIPLRCAVGMAFLFPTASGYSLVQVMMMQFVLYGVAAADQIWSVAVNNMGTPTGLTGSVSMNKSQLQDTATAIFNSMVCQQTLNTDPNCQAALNNQKVLAYSWNNQVYVGIPNDPNYAGVCGTIQPGATPNGVNQAQWDSANIAGIQMAAANLLSAANDAISGNTSGQQNVISAAAQTLQSAISSASATSTPTDTSSSSTTANYGWLFAGSYYFELLKGGPQNATYSSPAASGPSPSQSLGSSCNLQISNNQGAGQQYLNDTTVQTPTLNNSNSLNLQPANLSQPAAFALYNAIMSPVRGLVYDLLNYLTTNKADPISSLRQVGSNIMVTAENIWFAIMVLGFIILIGACVGSGFLSMCWAIGAIISLLIPVLTFILIFLWAAGVAIGLYLPMVPYLVFTFTALGWFVLVIEAIAAAPVVALGLVSPAAETLGKAAPAVMIITSVFLRPSLMIIGFIVAIKLVQATIMMVNFGFEATVKASTGGLGLFGCIALICLYGGLVITIIHECFSLVYVLPDKIIRWIGGPAEQSSVKASVQEVKGATEKGGEIGSTMMKGSMSVVEEKVGQKLEKNSGGPPTPTGLSQ